MTKSGITLSAVLVAAVAWVAISHLSAAEQAATAPTAATSAPAEKIIELPKPHMQGGMPLMEALKNRRSARAFTNKPLSDQILSDLLWAAFGVNRPEGRRTAPSTMNWQEMEIYVFKSDGTFVYDAKANGLRQVSPKDLRAQTGRQPFVKDAPLNLVFVADLSRLRGRVSEETMSMVSADAGFISQNVYLYCASAGLSTVVRGMVDRKELGEALGLGENQRIILAQTIGYPPPPTAPGLHD
jgi:SagB-type dehydrogenase family enzyme